MIFFFYFFRSLQNSYEHEDTKETRIRNRPREKGGRKRVRREFEANGDDICINKRNEVKLIRGNSTMMFRQKNFSCE